MRLDQLIKIRLETQKINKPKEFEPLEKGEDDPCWEGYVQLGTKILDGKEVPNCVPIKEEQSKEKFVIPTPDSGEEQDKYISRCISDIIDEYGQEQAAAICYAEWDKK